MENNIKSMLSECSKIDFGSVKYSGGQKEFYDRFNNEIILLCRALPESVQADALLYFMKHSGIALGSELNFFRDYYTPTWSVIFWLIHSNIEQKKLKKKDINNAITAHAMAMLLHALDDHLNDCQLVATHLALLIRSTAWMIMNNAFNKLAEGVHRGEKAIHRLINDYYSAICKSELPESLDRYCNIFRKQMATGLITPYLLTKKLSVDKRFAIDILDAYCSFGVAWKLLDDIKDIKTDISCGEHSSICTFLPNNMKEWWRMNAKEKPMKNSGFVKVILNYVFEKDVINKIMQRIWGELETAASIFDSYSMTALANEFRCLSRPLQN
jgi:hypothetical protein